MKACVNAILKRLELVVHNTPTAMTARAKRKVTVMEAVKTAKLAVLFKTAIGARIWVCAETAPMPVL